MDIQNLVELASNHIKANYVQGSHHVAAALKTSTDTYLALHLDTRGFDVCAEPIAISNALSKADLGFEYIVAITMNKDGTTSVISPCGNCRQILLEHTPGVVVIIESNGAYITMSPSELLPYPY